MQGERHRTPTKVCPARARVFGTDVDRHALVAVAAVFAWPIGDFQPAARLRRVCRFPRSRLNPPPGSEMVMQAACVDEFLPGDLSIPSR